jgi:trans-2,3-dihydro-3-hydroxyanthranilate isomerase
MRRRFITLDVFTTQRFAGNPLAVVLDAEGLDTGAMQKIAREFNLSETVFVHRPDDASARARLRIFTPGQELPFAGHPTVGTAVLLGRHDGGGDRSFVLQETVGPVPCRVRSTGPDSGWASFEIPRLPGKVADGPAAADMAESLGVSSADMGLAALPTELWSGGNQFWMVPIRDLQAIGRCTVNRARFDSVFTTDRGAAAFVFCRETTDRGHAFHARMFAPEFGIIEDPATGSAVAAFAGYLAAHGGYADGSHTVRIEQGYEMGRPSLIELTLAIAGGLLQGASIAGDAVTVLEGTI